MIQNPPYTNYDSIADSSRNMLGRMQSEVHPQGADRDLLIPNVLGHRLSVANGASANLNTNANVNSVPGVNLRTAQARSTAVGAPADQYASAPARVEQSDSEQSPHFVGEPV